MIRKLTLSALLTILLLPAMSFADDARVGSNLPPNIRGLLIREMIAVLDASQAIMDALVRGQDQRVAEHAQAIHDSFILEQEMSEEDMETLVASVPAAFLEKDEAFHELSAELAAAARNGDKEKQLTLFNRLVSSCVDCHRQHAQDRFPDLAH